MSFGLLWIETLLASLLFAAMLITERLRCKTRLARIFCTGAAFLPLVPLGILVAITAMIRFGSGIPGNAFWCAIVLFTASATGGIILHVLARRPDEAGVRRGTFWPLGRIAAAWLVVVSLIAMTCWNMDLQVQVEVQALRSEAGAMALSVAPPPIADSVNAALLYQLAGETRVAAMTAEDKTREVSETASYSDLDARSPELAAYLQRQHKALEIVRRAADTPDCRLEHDYSNADSMLLPDLGFFQNSARLLSLAAKAEAATGKPDLALADCRRIYAIGGHAGSSPMLISVLVARSVDMLASKTVAQVLPAVTSKAKLEQFTTPDLHALPRQLVRSLRNEEAFGLASFCDWASGKVGPFPVTTTSKAGAAVSWLIWLRDDVGRYRDFLERMRQRAEQPYYQTAAELKFDERAKTRTDFGLLTAIVAPSLARSLAQVSEAQALRAAVGMAGAATRYRLDHGEYPASAAALVPAYLAAVPVDPFDGQPLRFKKTTDGSLLIYSVGLDGVDNGGLVQRARDGKNRVADVGVVLKAASGR